MRSVVWFRPLPVRGLRAPPPTVMYHVYCLSRKDEVWTVDREYVERVFADFCRVHKVVFLAEQVGGGEERVMMSHYREGSEEG